MALVVRNLKIGTGMPKICVPITGQSIEEIKAEAVKIAADESKADLVEWRADWFEDVFDKEAVWIVLNMLRKIINDMPLIATFRTKKEGGAAKPCSLSSYKQWILWVIGNGQADLIDIEWSAGEETAAELIQAAHAAGVKVIMSNHDFEKTPSDDVMTDRLMSMALSGADIGKIAVMPHSGEDTARLLQATARMSAKLACPVITMAMGWYGIVSRLGGETFGSCITFGTAGKASAPGQIDAGKLRTILELIHGQKG